MWRRPRYVPVYEDTDLYYYDYWKLTAPNSSYEDMIFALKGLARGCELNNAKCLMQMLLTKDEHMGKEEKAKCVELYVKPSLSILIKEKNHGDIKSLLLLAQYYNLFTNKDERAYSLYLKAAEMGSAYARIILPTFESYYPYINPPKFKDEPKYD